ncbi:hypothetical protein QEN19_002017 [Hanseniaspora menglaensis]
MQNNFVNNEIPSRSVTPSLGFAASSSHLSSMQYNTHLNNFQSQIQQPQQSGFNSPLSPFSSMAATNSNSNFNSFGITSPPQPNLSLSNMNSNNKNFMHPQASFNPTIASMSSNSHMSSHPQSQSQQLIHGLPLNQISQNIPNLISNWSYYDSNNDVRGPFNSTQMDAWMQAGYLNMNLRICHVSCSPMNPFDDVNAPLNYPYGITNLVYLTLQEFMQLSNGNFSSKIFSNFDFLCSAIMKDFLSRGLTKGVNSQISQNNGVHQHIMTPQPLHLPHSMQNQQIHKPFSNMHINQPINNSSSNINSFALDAQTSSINQLIDIETISKISSKEELYKLNENNILDSKSIATPVETPVTTKKIKASQMTFKEALSLKSFQNPNIYNHIQRKKIGIQPSESKITRVGNYNSSYYMVADYTYNELFKYGMDDALGNNCIYKEYSAYMPIGKIVDDVIESDEWPEEFYKKDEPKKQTNEDPDNSSVSPEPEKVKVSNREEISKVSEYFARVHETRVDSDGMSSKVSNAVSSIMNDLVFSVSQRTPYINGSIITYLSKIDHSALKSLLVTFRIIFTSNIVFISSLYKFVTENFIGLLPSSELVFDKNIDLLDLPYDKNVYNFLVLFIDSIIVYSKKSSELVFKGMEVLNFFDSKNVAVRKDPTFIKFLNSSEFKKAKIDSLILKIDGNAGTNKNKKKKGAFNEVKIFNDKWLKANLQLFNKDLPIHYYLTNELDPRSKNKNKNNKSLPLFFWTKFASKNSTVIGYDLTQPIKKTNSNSNSKLVDKSAVSTEEKKPQQVKEKVVSPVNAEVNSQLITDNVIPVSVSKESFKWEKTVQPTNKSSLLDIITKENSQNKKLKEKSTGSIINSTKSQKFVEMPIPVATKKDTFKWEKEESPIRKASILDIINKKEEEEKKMKEAKKLEAAKVYEPPRDFIREAMLKEEKEKQKNLFASSTPWINGASVGKDTTANIREIMNQKSKKSVSTVSESLSPVQTVEPIKKNVMPETYTQSSILKKPATSDPLLRLVEEKKSIPVQPKEKTPVFNDDFIKEQERLLRELEMQKKKDDAQWVTIDKKQGLKPKKTVQIAKTANSVILNPDKLRKIAAPKVLKTSPTFASTPSFSSSIHQIPSSSQKAFLQWCTTNLGNAEFLSILFSIDQNNTAFFVDMVNSTGSNKPKISGATALEFFKAKETLESSKGFLSWNEALSNLNNNDDGWSFQTVKKKK